MTDNSFVGATPQDEDDFASRTQKLDCMSSFYRTLPKWAAKHESSVSFIIKGTKEGVELDATMPANANMDMLYDLISDIELNEKLMRLEFLIEELKKLGVDAEKINQFVEEAENLAAQIHPPEEE